MIMCRGHLSMMLLFLWCFNKWHHGTIPSKNGTVRRRQKLVVTLSIAKSSSSVLIDDMAQTTLQELCRMPLGKDPSQRSSNPNSFVSTALVLPQLLYANVTQLLQFDSTIIMMNSLAVAWVSRLTVFCFILPHSHGILTFTFEASNVMRDISYEWQMQEGWPDSEQHDGDTLIKFLFYTSTNDGCSKKTILERFFLCAWCVETFSWI